MQPQRGAASRGRVGGRPEIAVLRGVPPPKASPSARPFVWWSAHPWIVVWVFVFLAPASALAMRALDETGRETLVRPLTWGLVALFGVALALAMLASARRSVSRLVLGTIAVLAAVGTLMWLVTSVTLGRTACPPRAGADLGATVAATALTAWRGGAAGDAAWHNAQVDRRWRERSAATRLMEHQLVGSGCWERVAPIDATRTWHEFRVTVQSAEQAALSKSVVVHTAVGPIGWRITAIEGPLP